MGDGKASGMVGRGGSRTMIFSGRGWRAAAAETFSATTGSVGANDGRGDDRGGEDDFDAGGGEKTRREAVAKARKQEQELMALASVLTPFFGGAGECSVGVAKEVVVALLSKEPFLSSSRFSPSVPEEKTG